MPDDRLLLKTSKFNVIERTYRTPRGERVRPVVDHPGAVCILPLLEEDRVVLVRNHRAAVDQLLLEVPAGTLEPGESPAETAQRELAEETGYRATSIEHVCDFWMSPGILRERMHFFVARGLTPGEQSLDEGEWLEPVVVRRADLLAMVERGELEDAKTLVAILYYHQLLVR